MAVGTALEIAQIQQMSTADLQPIYDRQMERITRMARERNAQEKRRVRDVDPEGRALPYGYEGYVIGPK